MANLPLSLLQTYSSNVPWLAIESGMFYADQGRMLQAGTKEAVGT